MSQLVRVARCSECGYRVVPAATDGRFFEYRGVLINLPPELYVPRCQGCGVFDLTDFETARQVDVVLQELYVADADLIQQCFDEYHARQKRK